jgi:DNA-binding NtrC family response regulator
MKILVIDDIPEYVEVIENFVSAEFEDTDVFKAYDLEQAKRILGSGSVDIIIADIRLDENDIENKDGLLLIKWVKDNIPGMRMIAMSAYKEFDYAVEAMNSGANYFLKKPVKNEELIGVLKKMKTSS